MSENNQQQHPVTPTHSWGVITEVEGGFNGAPAQHEPQSIHQWRRVDKPELGWFDDTHERAYHADPKLEGRTLYSTPQPAQQKPVECQYGKGGYACCEGGPCKADEQNNAPRPAQQQEPTLCINPKVIDPATGKVRNGTGALTYSDTPCAGWSLPLYTSPPAQGKPLTTEEVSDLRTKHGITSHGRGIKEFTQIVDFVRAIEAAQGIKGDT